MNTQIVARASTTIDAPNAIVWDALVNPTAIKKYMFGTTVVTDWREGSSITWKGEMKGKHYEDKGKILQNKTGRTLQYTHFSPLSGEPDVPGSYHTVTIELSPSDAGTHVRLTQDNNATDEAREHSEENWNAMLEGLKKYVEG